MLRLGATPVCSRSSGTWAIPAVIAARGSPGESATPPTRTTPAARGRIPVTASASSRWPFPATPAIPRISPARTASEMPLSASVPRSPVAATPSSSSTTAPTGAVPSRRRVASTCTADHETGEGLGRRLGGRDGPDRAAATQHRDAVRHLEHLVELVRDHDHGMPLGRHDPDRPEELPSPPAASALQSARRGSSPSSRCERPS